MKKLLINESKNITKQLNYRFIYTFFRAFISVCVFSINIELISADTDIIQYSENKVQKFSVYNENVIRKGEKFMGIIVESSAFKEGGMIPSKYTCDGSDISPPISWSGLPDKTVSIALISDDPDAPMGTWVHWVLYDLPANVTDIPENVPTEKVLKNGGKQGITDFRRIGYGGPCPPSGTHRYYFKIYSLDVKLGLDPGASKDQLLSAMKGHILDEGQLMGKYKRSR